MNDNDPFPPALPAVVPSPIGPAVSYSNIRAVTSRAEGLLTQLEKKVRKHLQAGIEAAGMTGAKMEVKVLSRLADQLAPPEQLLSDTHTLLQNQIVANLAPAVATLEDLNTAMEVLPGGSSTQVMAAPLAAGTVASSVQPLIGLASGISARAMSPAGGPHPQIQVGPLKGENNPGLKPQGPCPMIDQATWTKWQTRAQAIADSCNKGVPPAGESFVGNWWRVTEDCCITGPARAPDDNPPPTVAKYFDFAVDGYPSCALLGFNWFLTQWDPKGLTCGAKPPVDCTATPFDPSCPPDCVKHPEDPRCPPITQPCPPPCIDVTCPPSVINIPPCPTLELPTCIQIDLCDWDKFCKALRDCIGAAKEDCALDNDTAYTYKDCDGTFGEAQKEWLGSIGPGIVDANNIEEVLAVAQQARSTVTADDFAADNPY